MGSWSPSITPPHPQLGAGHHIWKVIYINLHVPHTVLSQKERSWLTHIFLSPACFPTQGLLFKYKGDPVYSDDPYEVDLAQRPGHHAALSHPSGFHIVLHRVPPADSQEGVRGALRAGPGPGEREKWLDSSEQEERRFHPPEIKL